MTPPTELRLSWETFSTFTRAANNPPRERNSDEC